MLGRELQDVFPVAFLPENHALAIAIMSYNGGIDFGLLGDYDAMEDIETIATGLTESLADLLAAAEAVRGPLAGGHRRRRRPARLVPPGGFPGFHRPPGRSVWTVWTSDPMTP